MSSKEIELALGASYGAVTARTPEDAHGPGILVLYPKGYDQNIIIKNTTLYAAEGYNCISLTTENLDENVINSLINKVTSLKSLVGKIAVISFGQAAPVAIAMAKHSSIKCAVYYEPPHIDVAKSRCDVIIHSSTPEKFSHLEGHDNLKIFSYPDVSNDFFSPTSAGYNKPATLIAYSRTLEAIRNKIGPIYDLTALWELHTQYEFGERNVEATMSTMVDEPYVNHIPTMTGGVGYKNLKKFYTNFFVNSNPPDTKLVPISRTIGSDRLVDEMIFSFTHTCEVPWMLPNMKPTNKFVQVPLVAIVNFRGNKLYHEHIYWDQASVLAQVGAIDPKDLPIVGSQAAEKLMDEGLPSNELMGSAWTNIPE
ncbi:MAG: carboxymethylenebutenolidase [Gammaproteobacteria bacterium]